MYNIGYKTFSTFLFYKVYLETMFLLTKYFFLQDEEYYDLMFRSINGVLFPGGQVHLNDSGNI